MALHSRTLRRLSTLTAVTASIALLASCAGASSEASLADGSSGADCEVTSLIIGQFSGGLAAVGTDAATGSELAAEEINAAGGINGCDLVIETMDDGSDPTQDIPLLQSALSSGNEYINVNVANGYGAASATQMLMDAGILSISTNGTSGLTDPEQFPLNFAIGPNPEITDSALIKRIVADGHTKLGVITDNSAVGDGNVALATRIMEEARGSVEATEQVEPLGVVNFIPAIQRMQQADVDAIYLAVYAEEAGAAVRDWYNADAGIPLYGGQYVATTDLVSLGSVEGVENVTLAGPGVTSFPAAPVVADFIANLEASGRTTMYGYLMASLGYSQHVVLAWAANEAGSNDAQAIKEVLEANGDTEIAGLLSGRTTGWTAENHDLLGKESAAFLQAGPWDENSFVERIEYVEVTKD